MSTSRTAWLTKPEGDGKISAGTFGYINARIRQRAYDLVIREFKRSGITQAALGRRWGKTPDVVSRFLARPANWELNTISEALFAMTGAIPRFGVDYPSDARVAHHTIIDPQKPQTHSDIPPIPTLKVKSNNPAIRVVPSPELQAS